MGRFLLPGGWEMSFRILFGFLMLSSGGCGSLMMHVTEPGDGQSHLRLQKGNSVAVVRPNVDVVVEEIDEPGPFARDLRGHIVAELKDNGVETVEGSPYVLRVKVTRYETGCGFCRGFFPLFGLGDSALDGEVVLEGPEGQRTLILEKTGQMSGMSQMGDQTEANMEYFATVVVDNFMSEGAKGDDNDDDADDEE